MTHGDPMPEFSLQGSDGAEVSAGDLSHHRMLAVLFVSNHCTHTRAYFEKIRRMQDTYGSQGLRILLVFSNDEISCPMDGLHEMARHRSDFGDGVLPLRDESQDFARAVGVEHTPDAYLFDSDRRLIYSGCIDDNWRNEDRESRTWLVNAIEDDLSERTVKLPHSDCLGCSIIWKFE